MASGREKFGYAGGLEPCLCKTKGSTETSTTSTSSNGKNETDPTIEVETCLHDDSIEFMLDEGIFAGRPRLKK